MPIRSASSIWTRPRPSGTFTTPASPIDFYNWHDHNSTFDSMAAYGNDGANLSDGAGLRQRIRTANVTHNLLDVLGLKPALGCNFLPEEDRPKGAKVILLGYELWHSLFRGDRGIVGRIVKLDNEAYTVIGVLPREAVLPYEAQAWTPMDSEQSGSYFLGGVGRLTGVSTSRERSGQLWGRRFRLPTARSTKARHGIGRQAVAYRGCT
ncbi:MAG: ABC transporter permease, partial [Bryobacteraceae bacterium]